MSTRPSMLRRMSARFRRIGTARRLLPVLVPVRVDLDVLLPLLGNEVVLEDRLDRTDRLAGPAVDAGLRIDVEQLLGREIRLVLGGVDAVHGTYTHTCGVLGSNAGFSDRVGHLQWLLGPVFRRVE